MWLLALLLVGCSTVPVEVIDTPVMDLYDTCAPPGGGDRHDRKLGHAFNSVDTACI